MSDRESVSSGSSTSSQSSRSSNSSASSEDARAEKQRKVSPDKSRELSGNEKERKKHPTNSNPTPDNSIKADLNQGIKTQAQNSKEPSPTQPGNEQEETAEKKKPLSPSGEKEHSHGNIVKKTVSDEPEKDSINDGEGTDQEPKRQPPKQTKSAPSQVKYKARNQLLEEELSRIKARMNRTCSANLLKRPQRKLYHPFVWNSLHPYSDTYAIDYLLRLK